MDADALIDRLESTGPLFRAAMRGVGDADARWRPEEGAWSLLEIVSHVADEETEDFRIRLRLTLEDPAAPWPPIDTEAAVVSRRYNEGELEERLGALERERSLSVGWLRSLREPDWSRTHTLRQGRSLTAGDLLASWAAHDALHLRQIAHRFFQIVQRDAGTFRTAYAGEWGL